MHTSRVAVAFAALLVWLPTAAAHGQDAPPPAQAQGAPGSQDLSRWWEKSALEFEPMPDRLLVHTSADFSFSDSRGNTEGRSLSKRAELVLRKRRVTNRLSTNIQDQDMVYGLGGGASKFHESTTTEQVDVDLTKTLVAVGGVEFVRNTLFFIDARLTFYGGLGVTLFNDHGHKLSLSGGLGYARFNFMGEEMAQLNPVAVAALPTLTPTTGGALVRQAWSWAPSPRWSLQQSASMTEYFNQELGHLLTLDVNVRIPVAKHLAFVPRYTLKDEDNIYVEALGVKTLDRTFGIGIQLSF